MARGGADIAGLSSNEPSARRPVGERFVTISTDRYEGALTARSAGLWLVRGRTARLSLVCRLPWADFVRGVQATKGRQTPDGNGPERRFHGELKPHEHRSAMQWLAPVGTFDRA